jgi:hypothetical protein
MYFNAKADNFLDLPALHNIVCSSLVDEELIGCEEPVGTLQLYNKHLTSVTQDDLTRVRFIKKLVGASLIKCNYFAYLLQTLVGLNLRNEEMVTLK